MPATTLEWWLRYIASLLEKPISAIRFVATTVDGDSKVISDGCPVYKRTLLTCLQQDADGNILVQVLVDNLNLLREEVRPSGFEKRDKEEGAKTTATFPEWC